MPFLHHFSTKTPAEMIHNIAKKHSKIKPRVVHKCKKCDKYVHGSYNLREHKQKERGAHTCSGAQKTDVAHVMGGVDDKSLKEEMETCKQFCLTVRRRMGDTESAILPWILWNQKNCWKY